MIATLIVLSLQSNCNSLIMLRFARERAILISRVTANCFCINLHQGLVILFGRIVSFIGLTRELSHCNHPVRIVPGPFDFFGQVFRFIGDEMQAGGLIFNNLLQRAEARTENWSTAGKGFTNDHRETLVPKTWSNQKRSLLNRIASLCCGESTGEFDSR